MKQNKAQRLCMDNNSPSSCLDTDMLCSMCLNGLEARSVLRARSRSFLLYVTEEDNDWDNNLPGTWNKLPVILSHLSILKQKPSVALQGSCGAASDGNTSSFAFLIASTFLSSFGLQPLWHKTFSDVFFSSSFHPCSSITITTSCFPVPSICFRDPVNDWFESLAQCLHWNVRKKQNYLSSEDEEFWSIFKVSSEVSRTPSSWL